VWRIRCGLHSRPALRQWPGASCEAGPCLARRAPAVASPNLLTSSEFTYIFTTTYDTLGLGRRVTGFPLAGFLAIRHLEMVWLRPWASRDIDIFLRLIASAVNIRTVVLVTREKPKRDEPSLPCPQQLVLLNLARLELSIRSLVVAWPLLQAISCSRHQLSLDVEYGLLRRDDTEQYDQEVIDYVGRAWNCRVSANALITGSLSFESDHPVIASAGTCQRGGGKCTVLGRFSRPGASLCTTRAGTDPFNNISRVHRHR
jgi:hypothetical protein